LESGIVRNHTNYSKYVIDSAQNRRIVHFCARGQRMPIIYLPRMFHAFYLLGSAILLSFSLLFAFHHQQAITAATGRRG
jgi:hypothetical protein